VFDVNKAIADWRNGVAKVSKIGGDDLDELESHLHDHVEQLIEQGLTAQEAFSQAASQLGDADGLQREYSKVGKDKFGLLGFTNGRILAMSNVNDSGQRRLTWLLLFIGFSGITGWLGTTGWLIDSTNFQGTDFRQVIKIVGYRSLCTSFFLLFAVIGLGWGLRRLKRTERKRGLLAWSTIPPVLLTPVLAIGGIAVMILAPFCAAHVRAVLAGPDIEQSVISPDGNFEAIVVNKPSFDPPNQHLYVWQVSIGSKKQAVYWKKIAQLPEDVDRIEKIHWSPYSDVVVFQSYFGLIAVGLPDYGKVNIPLGAQWHYRDNGTFWVDYEDVKRIEAIEFPKPGAFSYRLEGDEDLEDTEVFQF
jgi:hypothetical protein